MDNVRGDYIDRNAPMVKLLSFLFFLVALDSAGLLAQDSFS